MKWRNYGVWLSLSSVFYMVLRDLGLQIDLTQWETYVTAILGVLGMLGIISNPEKGRGFLDRVPANGVGEMVQTSSAATGKSGELPSEAESNEMLAPSEELSRTENTMQQDQSAATQSEVGGEDHKNDHREIEAPPFRREPPNEM
ncbi:hypothetical protein ACFFIX_03540 [Metabacillus herbersteinensis]|uniref:Holin n=1 Tax=Metabacillus herbersteinensis TaxID=283816 RepID=A0ABV6GA19_9BACI